MPVPKSTSLRLRRTWTQAKNWGARRMYWAGARARTTTRNSAAWTTLRDRTTPIAAAAIATARIQKATCCSHTALLLSLRFGADLEGLRFWHGVHPFAELDLVVEHVGDLKLRVLV